MNYEINFLILQSQTEKVDKIRKEVKDLIGKFDGKITAELIYRKRKLAYEIKHEQYGFYTVYRFDLENGEVLKDLTKELNLLNTVSRHIIVRSDELPELPKEIGKDTMAEQEKRNKKTNNISPKKASEKILNKLDAETKSETKKDPLKTQAVTNDKKVVEETTAKETIPVKEKTSSEKTSTKKPTKKTSPKKEKTEEISMDDLDKKLDEILDI